MNQGWHTVRSGGTADRGEADRFIGRVRAIVLGFVSTLSKRGQVVYGREGKRQVLDRRMVNNAWDGWMD